MARLQRKFDVRVDDVRLSAFWLTFALKLSLAHVYDYREKEGDLTQSYDKPPIPTENSKTKGQHTQTPPKTLITQRLRTDLGRSVGVTSNPTGVVKPVYGIPTFPLTAKAV